VLLWSGRSGELVLTASSFRDAQWSRFSGGSGAPYWTILACGFEPQNFTKTRAAVIECEWPDAAAPDPAAFPKMIWATNYARLAVQTIFTLFFAGREYAPKCIIDGVNIQDYLQTHFFNAYRKLGEALAVAGDLLDETVIGWDSLNEPNAGYVGVEDLGHHGKESVLRVGPMPTGLQAMRMGMGERMEVENWKSGPLGPKRDGSVVVDPQGTIAWLAPEAEQGGRSPWGWQRDPGWKLGTCIWAQHGVWNVETGELLRPDYFSQVQGRPAEFGADFWLPFFQEWAPIIREVHPDAILFAHSPVFQIPPKITSPDLKNRVAFSSHFYDGLTLITKHWVSLISLSFSLCPQMSSAHGLLPRRTGSTRTPLVSCAGEHTAAGGLAAPSTGTDSPLSPENTLPSCSESRSARLRSGAACGVSSASCGKTASTPSVRSRS
jgi:hypothetical protein